MTSGVDSDDEDVEAVGIDDFMDHIESGRSTGSDAAFTAVDETRPLPGDEGGPALKTALSVSNLQAHQMSVSTNSADKQRDNSIYQPGDKDIPSPDLAAYDAALRKRHVETLKLHQMPKKSSKTGNRSQLLESGGAEQAQ